MHSRLHVMSANLDHERNESFTRTCPSSSVSTVRNSTCLDRQMLMCCEGAEPPPPTQQLDESQVSPASNAQPFMGSPAIMPYRTQALGNPNRFRSSIAGPSAASPSHDQETGAASHRMAASPTPSFKFSRQNRPHPSVVPAEASSPAGISLSYDFLGSPGRRIRPAGIGSPPRGDSEPSTDMLGRHGKRAFDAGPQNDPKGRRLGMGSPRASQQRPAGIAATIQPVSAGFRASHGSNSSCLDRGAESRGWQGFNNAGHAGGSQADGASHATLLPPAILGSEDRLRTGPMGFKPMVVSQQAASMQGRLGAGETCLYAAAVHLPLVHLHLHQRYWHFTCWLFISGPVGRLCTMHSQQRSRRGCK